jgi:hypothetical protein
MNSRIVTMFSIVLGALISASSLFSQQAKVIAITETNAVINLGTESGVKVGMTGRVYYEILIGNSKKPMYIAKFTVATVNQSSSEITLTQKTEEEIKPGYFVEFDQRLVPPPPPPAPTPPPPPKGFLSILSSPFEASVYLNNQYRGTTPLSELALDPKDYEITLKKEGYIDGIRVVSLRPNQHLQEQITLVPVPPKEYILEINTIPEGAKVYIDNIDQGYGSISQKLKEKTYDIRVEKNGYKSIEQLIKLVADTKRTIELEAIGQGKLLISCHPPAEVEIDGKRYREVPPVFEIELPEGKHTIRFISQKLGKEKTIEELVLKNMEKRVQGRLDLN